MTATVQPSRDGIQVSTEAIGRIKFYDAHYETLYFTALGEAQKPLVLGSKPFVCRFCDGTEPAKSFKKTAHAVSELLGNKYIRTLYECDDCNERFSKFEDDLGKATLQIRNVGAVAGKKGVPTLVTRSGKSRIEFKGGKMQFSQQVGDDDLLVDTINGVISFTYLQQPHRPLGAYKALCKAAFSMLPPEELVNFGELKQWLLQPDLNTYRVYGEGVHICLTSFIPRFRAFPQPVLAILRRKIDAAVPYLSIFIAFGNVSYQIFPHVRQRTSIY
jgi:hypothetical protein